MRNAKSLLLLLPLMLLGFVELQAQDTITVHGSIANNGGNIISVDIEVLAGRVPMTSTVKCNARGQFTETFVSNTTVSQATVMASILDCKRQTVVDRTSIGRGVLTAYLKLDYCSGGSGGGGRGCEAAFTVRQAYNGRTPIPGQIVIYENSKGHGLSYEWDFGDGNTSRRKNPKHSYSGNGPYLLCLAIADTTGCKDTICDSISVDTSGLYNLKKEGFSITIMNEDAPVNITLPVEPLEAGIYPNPVTGQAVVRVHLEKSAQVRMSVYDVSGMLIIDQSSTGMEGNNNLFLDMHELQPGAYIVKLSTPERQWMESVIKR